MLVCCCSRTSGGLIVRSSVADFFHAWPTPSAVIAAEARDIVAAIRPLGMQAQRVEALKRMSTAFATTVRCVAAVLHALALSALAECCARAGLVLRQRVSWLRSIRAR